MTSDELLEELGTLLGRCVNVIRELEVENAELKVRREWVPLTDAEIKAQRWLLSGVKEYEQYTGREQLSVDGFEDFARAIEAKLKEKNHD